LPCLKTTADAYRTQTVVPCTGCVRVQETIFAVGVGACPRLLSLSLSRRGEKAFYLHRNVWNPGPLPENVEPSLSSAGSLPNDSIESYSSSSIRRRYVSLADDGTVEMIRGNRLSGRVVHNLSTFTEYVADGRSLGTVKRSAAKRNGVHSSTVYVGCPRGTRNGAPRRCE